MDKKTGLLGNISNAFGGRQGLLSAGLPMMFGGPQMQQQALMQGLQYGGTMQAENRKTQAQAAQLNKTVEFLKQVNPELAQAVEMGAMSPKDAYSTHLKAEAPQKPASSAIANYQFAQQNGFDGSFMDYQTANKKAGAMTINNNAQPSVPEYNKLPAGYVYKRDANGQILIDDSGIPMAAPIAGGPAALEAEKAANAAKVKQESTARSGNVVLEDIDRALEGLEQGILPTSGPVGGALSNVPGTQAYDVGQLIETIKANSGFDRLQAMRDSSPTGGALGAINQSEMGLLQAAMGNLSQSQSAEQLKYNLERVKKIYTEIIHGPNAVNQTPAPQSGMPDLTTLSDEQLEAIANGR
jgi:hypothetical protein